MGCKGVGKRKPKKSKLFSNDNINGSSNVRSGERSLVRSLLKDKDTPLHRGSTHPSAGSKKNRKEK